jgi:hypothetical protein
VLPTAETEQGVPIVTRTLSAVSTGLPQGESLAAKDTPVGYVCGGYRGLRFDDRGAKREKKFHGAHRDLGGRVGIHEIYASRTAQGSTVPDLV